MKAAVGVDVSELPASTENIITHQLNPLGKSETTCARERALRGPILDAGK
ncbi:MAG: hypothetical protein KJN71_04040 [Acidimicrobiia bacterium]|nr:hypothetical protein [Acidimicrobiia bacterium]